MLGYVKLDKEHSTLEPELVSEQGEDRDLSMKIYFRTPVITLPSASWSRGFDASEWGTRDHWGRSRFIQGTLPWASSWGTNRQYSNW